ncbi:MAG: peptide deformylase [Candidatus Terrybacteria bacterium RIFCSPLOWO2_02_42_20]|uniref:Peptide deformylase n=1 Tax=Candidatus Terrybacteria bacterium RIFCSPLOWO2_02_42_20 TaxID=1802370 RepID=A0A1G2Q354_9BACT|nr:MAG: peptide deformylase [Candidatus Terrybacteria bacterium RIFCSPLOWO2_02_42_20]
MTTIVQTSDKVLRETAKEIGLAEIKSAKIKKILAQMTKALSAAKDGVALAATQIGVPLRVFIVLKEYTENKTAQELKEIKEKKVKPEIVVFINPKITKISKKKQTVREGCLSVVGMFGAITRAEKVTVEAYNEKGEKFSRGASGLLAQIFQHEMDHLNGILFTDTARNLEKIETK